MGKFEKILGGLSILLMLLILVFPVPFGLELFTLSMLLLSLCYFFGGFLLFNSIGLKNIGNRKAYEGVKSMRIIGSVLTGFVLSVLVIGILFVYMLWPFGYANLQTGLIMTGIVLIVSIMKNGSTTNDASFYKRMILRVCIIGAVGMILRIIPAETFFEARCSNCPESYIEAQKASIKDPTNKELADKADKERMKMIKGKEESQND